MFDSLKISRWRCERKFFITQLSKYEIESIVRLHPAIFSEIYHERSVNNIYFDSFAMTNYSDSVEGKSQRLKVRIRWYGSLFGIIENPVLEIKTKKGLLGSKISYPLDVISIDNNLTINAIHRIFKTSEIPDVIKLNLTSLNFSVLNSYTRKYFQSADKRFRITIDSDMRFIQLSPMYNSFSNESVDHINNVLELKYEKESNGYAEKITNYLPFRMTKSSKYVTGIERLSL